MRYGWQGKAQNLDRARKGRLWRSGAGPAPAPQPCFATTLFTCGGRPGTGGDVWLRRQRFDSATVQLTLASDNSDVDCRAAKDREDATIDASAADSRSPHWCTDSIAERSVASFQDRCPPPIALLSGRPRSALCRCL